MQISISRRSILFLATIALVAIPRGRAVCGPATGVLEGILEDKITGQPVIGAPFKIDGRGPVQIADERGKFKVTGLAPGKHSLRVFDPEHQPTNVSFKIKAAKTTRLSLALDPANSQEEEEVVIRAKRLDQEVVDRVIEVDEAKKIPGTQGDIIKIVQSMPGVARGLAMGGSAGPGIVIRGSAPEDSKVLIDGHEVPLLYHFGGLKSVFNSDVLKRIDFLPGGFGVTYGEATGGIVDVQTQPCTGRRYDGYVDLSLLDAGFLVKGPIGDKIGFFAAARRSTIDMWLPEVIPDVSGFEMTVAPVYYDYQAKVDWSPVEGDRLSIMAFGSRDEMKFLLNKPPSGDPSLRGDMSMWVDFHRLYLSWTHAPDKDWQLSTSLTGGIDRAKMGIGSERYLSISVPSLEGRADLEWEYSPDITIRAGLKSGVANFDTSMSMPRPPKEGEVPSRFSTQELIEGSESLTVGSVSAWAGFDFRPLPALMLTAGLRMDSYTRPVSEAALMPRFSLRYTLRPGTVFRAAVGLYYEVPQPDELSEILGNPDLLMERAWHFTLGFEQRLPADVELSVQAFTKSLDRLVVPDDETMYSNQGTGKISGLEIMIRRNLSDNLFGWVAYTLMRSKRLDGPGKTWRLFDFDQTHILTLVLGYRLPTGPVQPAHGLRDGWEFGLRFQFVSGNPITPIVAGVFDADYDTYQPVPGDPNSERLPYFHQLDLRVDYTWAFSWWALSVYLDVQNVYNHRAAEMVRYNYDFTQRAYLEGLPVIPYLGIKGSF